MFHLFDNDSFLGLLYILPESHSPSIVSLAGCWLPNPVAKVSVKRPLKSETSLSLLATPSMTRIQPKGSENGVLQFNNHFMRKINEHDEKPLGFTRFSDKVTLRLRWVNISGTPRSEGVEFSTAQGTFLHQKMRIHQSTRHFSPCESAFLLPSFGKASPNCRNEPKRQNMEICQLPCGTLAH